MASKKGLSFYKIYSSGIDIELFEYLQYQDLIEVFLKEKKAEIEDELEKIGAEIVDPEDPYPDLMYDAAMEEEMSISETFPHQFRASFYIQIISFIESWLRYICEHHVESNNSAFRLSDLKGSSDIDKAKLYLSRSLNLDFATLNPEWTFILRAKEVRNRLVHHQSTVRFDNSKLSMRLQEFIESKAYFSVEYRKVLEGERLVDSQDGQLTITSKEANDELLKATKSFFTKLLEDNLAHSEKA